MATRIEASPDSVVLTWIGDTARASVRVLDQAGAEMADPGVAWSSREPSVATVDASGGVTAVAAGRTFVTASTAGLADSVAVRVAPRPWILRVEPDSIELTAVGQAAALSAAVLDRGGTAMDAGAPAWTSSDPAVAAVDAQGVVTAVAPGSATVTASVDSLVGEAVVRVVLSATTVDLTPDSLRLTYLGDTASFTGVVRDAAGAAIPGASITWTSSDDGVATVDTAGNVVAVGDGAATVTANAGGARASGTVVVAREPVSASIEPDPVVFHSTYQVLPVQATVLDAGGSPMDAPATAWTTADPTIAGIDHPSAVVSRRPGTTTVTASFGGLSATAQVIVDPVPAGISLGLDPTTMEVGDTVFLHPVLVDSLGRGVRPPSSVTLLSRDTTVATVQPGRVAGIAPGLTRVVGTGDGFTDSIVVQVEPPPPTSYDIPVDSLRLAWAHKKSLYVNYNPGPGDPPSVSTVWETSDPAVVTVDLGGTVWGAGEGTAWVRARADTLVDSVKVTVVNGPTRITTQSHDVHMDQPDGAQLVLSGIADDGTTAEIRGTYESRDSTVVWIRPGYRGDLETRRAGETWVIARALGMVDSVHVTVSHVWWGVVDVRSKADIDTLVMRGVQDIRGGLNVYGTDLGNVDGLDVVRRVSGDVWVKLNPSLENMDGLTALRAIDGNLYISDNPKLVVPPLAVLDSVGALVVNDNGGFTSEGVFPALVATGSIEFDEGGPALAFPSLRSVPGHIHFGGPGPAEIHFPVLTTTRGISVSDNAALASITVPALTQGSITITNARSLTGVEAPLVTTGDVVLKNDSALAWAHFPELRSAGTVNVAWDPVLADLALPSLTSADDIGLDAVPLPSLDFSAVDARTVSVTAMPVLTSLSLGATRMQRLSVGYDPALRELRFPSAADLGYFAVIHNGALATLDAPLAEQSDWLILRENPALERPSFPSLTTIRRQLEVSDNAALVAVDLPVLTTIRKTLTVDANGAMTDLDWLGTLTSWITGLEVKDNPVLTRVDGLSELGSNHTGDPTVYGPVTFVDNPQLPTSAIQALLDALEARFPGSAFGTVTVSGNAP